MMTFGLLLAGLMRAIGLQATGKGLRQHGAVDLVKPGTNIKELVTHAILAAPRMPNLNAWPSLATTGALTKRWLRRAPLKTAPML